METQEYSESGDPIYRYENAPKKEFTFAIGDGDNIEAITTHIEQNIGKPEIVFHEIVSNIVHIDVHWVKPSKKFPFHSLVTSGMSDLPMKVPIGYETNQYAELCILLPDNCNINGEGYETMREAFKDDNSYWPVFWLKYIARMPHEYNNCIGSGHTIPNGEEAEPYANNTKFCCMMLFPSITFGKNFYELKVSETKTIRFYCLYPLYKEEMDFKLKYGSDKLTDLFQQHSIADVVDLKRKNVCAKKGFLGLW